MLRVAGSLRHPGRDPASEKGNRSISGAAIYQISILQLHRVAGYDFWGSPETAKHEEMKPGMIECILVTLFPLLFLTVLIRTGVTFRQKDIGREHPATKRVNHSEQSFVRKQECLN